MHSEWEVGNTTSSHAVELIDDIEIFGSIPP